MTCSLAYSNSMLDIYRVVTAHGQPNFRGAHLPLPSNFDVHQWSAIAHTQADLEVLQYLKYGFPVGFEGPIPTPSFSNHSSAVNYPRDIKAYIATELSEGPRLGSFPQPPFTPWCQTNPLLTRPKRNSPDRWVIMDLSWPLPLLISINSGTPRESSMDAYKKMHLPSA